MAKRISNSKATYIFFKMYGCGHCTVFAEGSNDTKSEWEKITSDPELIERVNFVLYQFGRTVDASNRPIMFDLDPVFKQRVGYAPYFWLHLPNQPGVGETFKEPHRTYEAMKEWILTQLDTSPTFAVLKAKPEPAKEQMRGAIPTQNPYSTNNSYEHSGHQQIHNFTQQSQQFTLSNASPKATKFFPVPSR